MGLSSGRDGIILVRPIRWTGNFTPALVPMAMLVAEFGGYGPVRRSSGSAVVRRGDVSLIAEVAKSAAKT